MPLIYRDQGFVERRLSHGPGEDKFVGPGVSQRTVDADIEQRCSAPIQPDEIVHDPTRWQP